MRQKTRKVNLKKIGTTRRKNCSKTVNNLRKKASACGGFLHLIGGIFRIDIIKTFLFFNWLESFWHALYQANQLG
ncbi:hypothetical protein LC20_09085 [Yersinia hibernica]|uniref:Uncharacterized protein n=1 Tax=Yersinia enterocolitica LC20 TaxID=1443113 RepID=A0A7U5PH20_YEREN|nr:hypothetical protein LC20_09085 [Yersinia hibernica]OVZ93357.1 hypothetical protein CBW54_02265 [Yersinia kristensenii]